MKKSGKASKKSVKKTSKKAVKKIAAKAPAKKTAPPKKVTKKAAKKIVKKAVAKPAKAKTAPRKIKKEPESFKDTLQKVMVEALKDIYYAEKQMVKALGKLAKASHSEDLKNAFEDHRQETEGHVAKLEEAFAALGMRPTGKKCPAMDGLVEEGKETIEEYDKGPARDAALIMSAQKTEHYEISAYGTLRAFAQKLGNRECAGIFGGILEQESAADEKLTGLASGINDEAAAGDARGEPSASGRGVGSEIEDDKESEDVEMVMVDEEDEDGNERA